MIRWWVFCYLNNIVQVNKLNYKLEQVPEEPDHKAKKGDPVIDYNTTIVHELKSGKLITFALTLVYQGPDIEDPNQPTQ